MHKKNGFTLLEVLIVVVIAVSVAAFALPAYKKTQEKNKYMAAQGILLDLGSAVRAVRADMSSGSFPSGSSPVQVTTSWNSTAAPANEITSSNANYELFRRKYMAPIPFDSGNTYKGFSFYVCPQGKASSSNCCGNNSEVIVCMQNPSLGSASSTGGQYEKAKFMEDGTIKRS